MVSAGSPAAFRTVLSAPSMIPTVVSAAPTSASLVPVLVLLVPSLTAPPVHLLVCVKLVVLA